MLHSKMASPRLAVAALLLAPVAAGQYSTVDVPIPGGGWIKWNLEGRGVPHVEADTDYGAFWGWGYAMSMDRYLSLID